MRFVDEFRDAERVRRGIEQLHRITTRPWTLMEICGGQTHAILRYGIDQLLPEGITLVHGPGCPVCVTPVEIIDQAIAIARQPGVLFCSFGDMLRVPGTSESLLHARAEGADVRVVYSPMDAVKLAQTHPDRQVVFFAVGFETTAPANAHAVRVAAQLGLKNFSMLVAHVLVPPAIRAILSAPGNRVQGFLAAGHVCTVMGYREYEPIAQEFHVPIVVTGFEPLDLVLGLVTCIQLLEQGKAEVVNQYSRSVRPDGNLPARREMETVFQIVDRNWRGIGLIPQSGLGLREEFAQFDAARRFQGLALPQTDEGECLAGKVLQGLIKPTDCPAFGTRCTPEHPLGAPMVSSEGACAAYYRYRLRTAKGAHTESSPS